MIDPATEKALRDFKSSRRSYSPLMFLACVALAGLAVLGINLSLTPPVHAAAIPVRITFHQCLASQSPTECLKSSSTLGKHDVSGIATTTWDVQHEKVFPSTNTKGLVEFINTGITVHMKVASGGWDFTMECANKVGDSLNGLPIIASSHAESVVPFSGSPQPIVMGCNKTLYRISLVPQR